jgi:hypothetical protein
MIERRERERSLCCDECQSVYGTVDEAEFAQLFLGAREAGWFLAAAKGGPTQHICPNCLERKEGPPP